MARRLIGKIDVHTFYTCIMYNFRLKKKFLTCLELSKSLSTITTDNVNGTVVNLTYFSGISLPYFLFKSSGTH